MNERNPGRMVRRPGEHFGKQSSTGIYPINSRKKS